MAKGKIAKKIAKKIANIFLGLIALAFSSVVNAFLGAVLLVRFIIMIILRSTSTVVEFVGETTLNILAFARDTIFAILTFVIQTATSVILFTLNQFVSVWTLAVALVTNGLGETCYLARQGISRILDAFNDFTGSLEVFSTGVPGLLKVVKAQSQDMKTGVDVKGVVKQAVFAIIDTLKYIIKGDEGAFSDGLIPNVFIEVFKALPLTVDLAKLILMGTWDISKETLSVAFSSAKELLTLTDVFKICFGKT